MHCCNTNVSAIIRSEKHSCDTYNGQFYLGQFLVGLDSGRRPVSVLT